MPTKIDINRQKRGRPTKAKQSKNRKKCQEAYENYYSAGGAANLLDLNRHTVEKYFREFQEAEIEETNYDFILRQRSAKNRVLTKLDGILEELYGQLLDIKNVIFLLDQSCLFHRQQILLMIQALYYILI